METKIPSHLLKPRHLTEVPRSKYVVAPQLKSNDEKSRKSFIAKLRKGIDGKGGKTTLPSSIKINCALWLSLSKPIDTCVSLVLHCKESKEDYCIVLDETTPQNSESLMLSGNAEIRPTSAIKHLHISCCGIPSDYHLLVNDVHIDTEVSTQAEELRKIG